MSNSKGFTLAEMAVAVVILALLLFGAMVPFSAQIDLRSIAETRRTMDSIRDAIIGFAQANGRLPCPADGNIAAGAANAGVERFNGTSCNAALGNGVLGVVPWATLGTPEADAWGHRFTYRVSPAFADAVANTTWNTRSGAYTPPAPPPTYLPQTLSSPTSPANQNPRCDVIAVPAQASFALCTLGDIAVFTRSVPGTAASPLNTSVPAIFVSHGKAGLGSWQSNGVQLAAPPAGTDELVNASGGSNLTPSGSYASWSFYSRPPTPSASGCADPAPPGTSASPFCAFDDIVAVISSNALIARMVAASKLP